MITSKGMEHDPQYTIDVRNWSAGENARTSDYTFAAPGGATEIPVGDLGKKFSDLPGNFSKGNE